MSDNALDNAVGGMGIYEKSLDYAFWNLKLLSLENIALDLENVSKILKNVKMYFSSIFLVRSGAKIRFFRFSLFGPRRDALKVDLDWAFKGLSSHLLARAVGALWSEQHFFEPSFLHDWFFTGQKRS